SGTLLTSRDGINWTSGSSGITTSLAAITYGAGQFVAAGWFRTILTSPDGDNWTARNSGTWRIFSSVAYGNSRFLALDGENILASTQDGLAILAGSATRGITLRQTSSDLFASYPGFTGRPVHAVIYTARGKKVTEAWGRGDEISLSIGGLARGIYTLEVASGKERFSSSFVKP